MLKTGINQIRVSIFKALTVYSDDMEQMRLAKLLIEHLEQEWLKSGPMERAKIKASCDICRRKLRL